VNGTCCRASERVQRGRRILATKIGAGPVEPSRQVRFRSRQPEKENIMLRKFAVALLAASVFTAPVFAQGGGATATPPAKTESKSGTAAPAASTAATPKVTAHSHHKRYARHHVRHIKHVTQVKRVEHVKSAHVVRGAKGDKLVRRDVSKSTTGTNGAMTAPKQKGNVN
jgi:hypothetical protein